MGRKRRAIHNPKFRNRSKYDAIRKSNNSDLEEVAQIDPQNELNIQEINLDYNNEHTISDGPISVHPIITEPKVIPKPEIIPEVSLFNGPEPEPVKVEEKKKPARKPRKPTTRRRTTRKKTVKKEVAWC